MCGVFGGGTPSRETAAYWGGDIPWVSPKDMKRREIGSSEESITEEALEDTAVRLLQPPLVLIVVRGMILAHSFPVALTTAPITINQDMKALMFGAGMDASFATWLLEGLGKGIVAILVDEAAHGTRVLRMDRWFSMLMPIPPGDEQVEIDSFLHSATGKIDQLATKARHAISLLREYRTALISAAVTGQIDVSDEAA